MQPGSGAKDRDSGSARATGPRSACAQEPPRAPTPQTEGQQAGGSRVGLDGAEHHGKDGLLTRQLAGSWPVSQPPPQAQPSAMWQDSTSVDSWGRGDPAGLWGQLGVRQGSTEAGPDYLCPGQRALRARGTDAAAQGSQGIAEGIRGRSQVAEETQQGPGASRPRRIRISG